MQAVRIIRAAVIVLAGLALVNGETRAQSGAVAGTVRDASERPVESAEITLLATNFGAKSDKGGGFNLAGIPAKSYFLMARRLGFKPVNAMIDVKPGDTLRLSLTLEPAVQELGTVAVTGKSMSAKLSAFETRRLEGHGEYFTGADIESRGAMSVADVLRQSKSVNIRYQPGNVLYAFNNRPGGSPMKGTEAQCPYQIYVDGVQQNGTMKSAPMGSGTTTAGARNGAVSADDALPVDLNSLLSAKEIAGMEVHNPANTPVEYNSGPNRWCGVILIWTKDR